MTIILFYFYAESNAFERWNLEKKKLVLMLRDNASNAKKACTDWGIESFGCISHSRITGAMITTWRY